MINGNFVERSLSVGTESSIALHTEISVEKKLSGLSCAPLNQYTENQEPGFHTFLQCRFDLAKAKADSIPPITEPRSVIEHLVLMGGHDATQTSEPKNAGKIIQSADRHLIVSCVPSCDSLILTGGTRPRTIRMDSNPKTVLIFSDDHEIIARKRDYLPKHIFLSGRRKPAENKVESESLEVHLERP
jgi:hypothetical protein